MQPELLLFISQPMNGFTDEEILAERERIREKVSELYPHHYINLIDSFFGDDFQKNAAKVQNKGAFYLGASISKLADADIAYFGKGWDNARGCKIEHEVAVQYGINVVIEEFDDRYVKRNVYIK